MALGRGMLGLFSLLLLLLLPLPAAVLGEDCQAYIDYSGKEQPAQSCPDFCCGSCTRRFCCSNVMLRFAGRQLQCVLHDGRMYVPGDLLNKIQEAHLGEHLDASEKIEETARKIRESMSNSWLGRIFNMLGFTVVGWLRGLIQHALMFVVTIIVVSISISCVKSLLLKVVTPHFRMLRV